MVGTIQGGPDLFESGRCPGVIAQIKAWIAAHGRRYGPRSATRIRAIEVVRGRFTNRSEPPWRLMVRPQRPAYREASPPCGCAIDAQIEIGGKDLARHSVMALATPRKPIGECLVTGYSADECLLTPGRSGIAFEHPALSSVQVWNPAMQAPHVTPICDLPWRPTATHSPVERIISCASVCQKPHSEYVKKFTAIL